MRLTFQTKKEVAVDIERQSSALTRFYREILKWAESGEQNQETHSVFLPWYGLCTNLSMHSKHLKLNRVKKDMLQNELFHQLKHYADTRGTSVISPFNRSASEYRKEVLSKTTFSNRYRMRWVVDHAHLLTLTAKKK